LIPRSACFTTDPLGSNGGSFSSADITFSGVPPCSSGWLFNAMQAGSQSAGGPGYSGARGGVHWVQRIDLIRCVILQMPPLPGATRRQTGHSRSCQMVGWAARVIAEQRVPISKVEAPVSLKGLQVTQPAAVARGRLRQRRDEYFQQPRQYARHELHDLRAWKADCRLDLPRSLSLVPTISFRLERDDTLQDSVAG